MGESLQLLVVDAVARAKGVDPTTLPPLYDVVDPDALDNLFPSRDGRVPPRGEIRFEYAGRGVTVCSDGDVIVQPEDVVTVH